MPIQKIAYSSLELQYENYINILRDNQSVTDTGWRRYADTAGINPVTGTGGSPGITWSQNTSNPLSGNADLRFVKDAVNRQGNGVSIDFTVDNRHLAKVLQISFDAELIPNSTYLNVIPSPVSATFSVSTNTCTVSANHSFVAGQVVNMTFGGGTRPPDGFYTIVSVTSSTFVITVASGSGTSVACTYTAISDLRLSIIQDPTGTPVVIEPVNTNIQLGVANQRIKHIATFQTHLSLKNYRLCIHVGNAGTTAFTVDFANFRVWEPAQSIGAVITDWASYNAIDATDSTALPTTREFEWRRVGSNVQIRGRAITNASTFPATLGKILIPNGLKFAATSTMTGDAYPGRFVVGRVNQASAGSTSKNFNLMAVKDTGANLNNSYLYITYNVDNNVNPSFDQITWGNLFQYNTTLIFEAEFPVLGWGSSVAMSSDTGDSRVVALYVQGTLTSSISADAAITWASLATNQDTHGAYNFSTGVYTAPIQGYYNVSGFLNTNASLNTFMRPWVNGVNRISYFSISTSSGYFNIAGGIFLNAGDQLTLRPHAAYSAVSLGSFLYISRVSASSQVIASSETVACEAVMTSSNNPGTDQPIRFNSVVRDTHGAYNTSTYRYTIPMSGWYQIGFMYNISTGGHTTEWVYLFVNGTRSRTFLYLKATPDTDYYPGSITAYFLSGDIIDIRSAASTAPNFYGDPTNNTRTRMTVHRIGL